MKWLIAIGAMLVLGLAGLAQAPRTELFSPPGIVGHKTGAPRAESEPAEVTNPQPPLFAMARLTDDGQIEINRPVARLLQVSETRQVKILKDSGRVDANGMRILVPSQEQVNETTARYVTETQISRVSPQDAKLLRDGKAIESNAVLAHLKWTPVVINHSGSPLDPFFEQFLAKGLLHIVFAAAAPPTYAPEAGASNVPAYSPISAPMPASDPARAPK